MILDVTMPELDGYQTLERIRDLSDVPVLMLTARDAGAREGSRPVGGRRRLRREAVRPQELLARVQALLRRSGGKSEVIEAYTDAFTQVDYAQRQVKVQGRDVQLTPLEFKLLSAFVAEPEPGALARPASRARVGRLPTASRATR